MHDAQITLCVHVGGAKVSDTQCLSVTGTGQYVDMDMYEGMCVHMLLCMNKYRPH